MPLKASRWEALPMNGGEGLLIILGVVVGGGLVVYLIVRLSDRW
jgi:hypothetical protein